MSVQVVDMYAEIFGKITMATIKSFTDISQSKKLAEILPIESADMCINSTNPYMITHELRPYDGFDNEHDPSWSLAALLDILHSKAKDIPSLSGGGYKDGEYISDWCLDYEFENGDYQKTFADNPIDACYEMILKLKEKNLL